MNPTRASILKIIDVLSRVVEEHDDDPRGHVSATRTLVSEIERLIGGHPRAGEMLRYVRSGTPSPALGVAQEILRAMSQEAA